MRYILPVPKAFDNTISKALIMRGKGFLYQEKVKGDRYEKGVGFRGN